jgi:hypothetical protein
MSKRPKFTDIDPLKVKAPSRNIDKWEKENGISPVGDPGEDKPQECLFGEDLKEMEHLNMLPVSLPSSADPTRQCIP